MQTTTKNQQHKEGRKDLNPQKLNTIFEIVDNYDHFIIDVWGVLHNGMAPFPGAVTTLTNIMSRGKNIILLTNSPRSADTVERNLSAFGIDKGSAYSDIVTSGDITKGLIKSFVDKGMTSCYFIGSRKQHTHLTQVPKMVVVDDIGLADFILLSGPDDDKHYSLDYYQKLLSGVVTSEYMPIPMICANPDISVMVGGEEVACAGTIAKIYEALGGEVKYSGKPFAEAYVAVYEKLGIDRENKNYKKGIVCIGDSLKTDIAGAMAQKLSSVLVRSGVYGQCERAMDDIVPTYEIESLK